MTSPAPRLHRYNVASYFALADAGLVSSEERVELLDGLVVAMAPQSPLHAAAVHFVGDALREAFPRGTVIRTQAPFVASDASVPEPDVAVVPGRRSDHIDAHPRAALLIVEVAVATVAQDRLTKALIYAAAGVPNYWIVCPAEESVDVYRHPVVETASYKVRSRFGADAVLDIDDVAGVRVACRDLFPRRQT